jgi:penicillin-binding protein 1B
LPLKLKYGSNRPRTARGVFSSSLVRGLLIAMLACLAIGAVIFGIAYFHYQHVVDDRLAAGPLFASESQIYAAPREVRPGQKFTAAAIADDLRRANYNNNPQLGTYKLNGDTIFIKPGPESYHSTDGATIDTTGGVVQKITAENGVALAAYDL